MEEGAEGRGEGGEMDEDEGEVEEWKKRRKGVCVKGVRGPKWDTNIAEVNTRITPRQQLHAKH